MAKTMITRRHKTWSQEEDNYLCEQWGSYGGIAALARTLDRSENAIRIRAKRLNLGAYLDDGRYVSLNQLLRIIDGKNSQAGCVSYTYEKLLKLGVPYHKIRVVKSIWRMVDLDEFWIWAEQHKEELNFARFEENALGAEPEWAKKKRMIDQSNRQMIHSKKCQWTKMELEILKAMLSNGATYEDMAKVLKRTSGSICRKIYDLYLPHPTRARQNRWQKSEVKELAQLLKDGFNCDYCAAKLKRSPEAVRGMIERMRKKGFSA